MTLGCVAAGASRRPCDTYQVIPSVIVAALLLGLWLRYWAVPVATIGWAVVMVCFDASQVLPGTLLGAANALVGVLIALAVRRLFLVASKPPSGVGQLGWQESFGSVFFAGSAAFIAGWLAHRFAPGLAETPLSTFAVGTVAFVVVLWGITVFLIPGRRPSSMSGRLADTAWSVAAGLLIAGIAIGSTSAYLSSIKIDDGLEGLMFIPTLGAASILVAFAARWWSGQFRPVVGAVAACAGVAVAATVHTWSRSAGPSVLPMYTLTMLLFLPVTLAGVAVGSAVGDILRNARRERGIPHARS